MKIRLLDLAGAAEELFEPAVGGGGIESSPMGALPPEQNQA